jgi:ATP sulfurylase
MQLNEEHGRYHFMFGSDHAIGTFLTVFDPQAITDANDEGIVFEVDNLTQRGSTPELDKLAKECLGLSYNKMIAAVRRQLGV